ncbi:MAG: hypothetical protein ACRDA5_12435, partial [Clostridium sp.]
FGRKAVIITGVIGTTIHEFSHYIMCKIFMHKVNSIKWFSISTNDSEELGYVSHSYNRKSIYQRVGNFFIGVAPIIVGSLILVGFFYLLLPESFNSIYSQINIKDYVMDIGEFNLLSLISVLYNNFILIIRNLFSFENLTTIRFWIYLFISVSISTHMSLSKADLKNSLDGVSFIFLLSIIASTMSILLKFNTEVILSNLLMINCILIGFISIGFIFSLMSLLIIKIICFRLK